MTWTKNEIEDMFSRALEEYDLEDILDQLDLTPVEVLVFLYRNGMLDEDVIEENYSTYAIN